MSTGTAEILFFGDDGRHTYRLLVGSGGRFLVNETDRFSLRSRSFRVREDDVTRILAAPPQEQTALARGLYHRTRIAEKVGQEAR